MRAPDADAATYPPLPPYVVDDSPLSADYSIYDHAKECYERFRVEVPAFDCDGPDSSRIKIEVGGNEVTDHVPTQCDKPGLVGTKYACVPGARVTKFEQVNMYGHRIATVVACRRSSYSSLDSGLFDNIAILQSDLENAETCWYQIRKDANFSGRGIPAPYHAGRVKNDADDTRAADVYESPVTLTTDHTECYRCHDSQVWLATPWIDVKNQVKSATGHTSEIPRVTLDPTYIGKAYRSWNAAANRPKHIRIGRDAFDLAEPLSSEQTAAIAAGTLAPSDTCTSCHSVGKSDIATSSQGSCNHFARYFMPHQPTAFASTASGSKVSTFGNSFPLAAWMPPSASSKFTNEADTKAFYARAVWALQTCCDDPSHAGCTQ